MSGPTEKAPLAELSEIIEALHDIASSEDPWDVDGSLVDRLTAVHKAIADEIAALERKLDDRRTA